MSLSRLDKLRMRRKEKMNELNRKKLFWWCRKQQQQQTSTAESNDVRLISLNSTQIDIFPARILTTPLRTIFNIYLASIQIMNISFDVFNTNFDNKSCCCFDCQNIISLCALFEAPCPSWTGEQCKVHRKMTLARKFSWAVQIHALKRSNPDISKSPLHDSVNVCFNSLFSLI